MNTYNKKFSKGNIYGYTQLYSLKPIFQAYSIRFSIHSNECSLNFSSYFFVFKKVFIEKLNQFIFTPKGIPILNIVSFTKPK